MDFAGGLSRNEFFVVWSDVPATLQLRMGDELQWAMSDALIITEGRILRDDNSNNNNNK